MKKYIRNLESEKTSFRAFEEEGKRYLEGYASIFDTKSKPIFEQNRLFYEVISRRAFDEVLNSESLNTVLTFNHKRDMGILARTKSGTLQLSTDDVGLHFRAEVPNTTLGNDIYELVSRGDIAECSFGFVTRKGDDTWAIDDTGNNIRTVNRVAKLYDVSVVIDGAYENTEVNAREDEDNDGTGEENAIDPSTGETDEEVEENACKKKRDEELERMRYHVQILKLKLK
jgi:hypothetical protein